MNVSGEHGRLESLDQFADFKYMSLESAIELATQKHRGQKDLGGHPYILHALHVMREMYDLLGEEMAIAGVLHDILEDTPVTVQNLIEWHVPPKARVVIVAVTRDKSRESYRFYIERIRHVGSYNTIALKVADIKHNLDANRLDPKDVLRYRGLFRRELKAIHYLQRGVWE